MKFTDQGSALKDTRDGVKLEIRRKVVWKRKYNLRHIHCR